MPDKEATPPIEDIRFFQEIAADIKARPDFYREAGRWLDENSSNAVFEKRERAKRRALLRKEKAGKLRGSDAAILTQMKGRRYQTEFLMLRRLVEAARVFRESAPAFPTDTQAKRILLMTWLMTDPEADRAELRLTEFEHWPWYTKRDGTDGDLTGRRYASDFWRYPSGNYDQWVAMARRAWQRLEPSVAGHRKGASSQATAAEAVEQYLRRILGHATAIDDELQHSKSPTYPVNQLVLRTNCQVLRWRLRPVVPLPGPFDIDAVTGYGVEPITLLSFFGARVLNPDIDRALRWLADLSGNLGDACASDSRPGDDLVKGWHDATGLLSEAVGRAVQDDLPRLSGSPSPMQRFIEGLLAGPEDRELDSRDLALLKAYLGQPVCMSDVQREKRVTGRSKTLEDRRRLEIIRDYNRSLHRRAAAKQPPTPPETEAPPHAGPPSVRQGRRRKGGRPRLTTNKTRCGQYRAWARAWKTGKYKTYADCAADFGTGVRPENIRQAVDYARKHPGFLSERRGG